MTDRPLTECYPWFRLQKHGQVWQADGAANVRYGERLPGEALPAQGVTGGWVYENGSLIVENDALGFLPIFISHSERDFIVAPSPLVVSALKEDTILDPDALAFFLKFGYFIEEDTPFAGVRGLPPGARVTWRDGVVEQKSISLTAPAPVDVSPDQALDRYAALFAQSMARRRPLPGGTALIPLSGGRDSRHIALELAAQQPREPAGGDGARAHFLAVTSSLWRGDNKDTHESMTAAKVAARIGFAHETVPAVQDVLANEARKNLLTGFCCDEASLISGLISQMAPPACVYDGIGGDVLSDGDCCQPVFGERIKDHNIRGMIELFYPYNDGVRDSLWPLIKPLTGGREKPPGDADIVYRVAAQFDRWRDYQSPAVAYHLFTRTRREISLAPFMLWGAAGRAYAPFLDYDLVMYLLALPPAHFENGAFHANAIARFYPHAADIPYSDVSATPSPVSKLRMMAQVISSAFFADPERPVTGGSASIRFFTHYSRARANGANWRLLNLVLQLVKLMRRGPASARLGGADNFQFSHDDQFQPRDAQRVSAEAPGRNNRVSSAG